MQTGPSRSRCYDAMSGRQALYAAARLFGDLSAARRGPAAMGRRLVRRQAYRTTNALLGRGLRRWGL